MEKYIIELIKIEHSNLVVKSTNREEAKVLALALVEEKFNEINWEHRHFKITEMIKIPLKCGKCGKEVPDDSIFCNKCGEKIDD